MPTTETITWHAVEERMPIGDRESVLVMLSGECGVVVCRYTYRDMCFEELAEDHGERSAYGITQDSVIRVTHWAELPKGPR